MKKSLFILLFFITFAAALPIAAQEDLSVKTLRTLVPYEDLYKVLEKDAGKYFIMPIDEFEHLKNQKEAYLAAAADEQTATESAPIGFSVYNAVIEGRLEENFAHLNAKFYIEKFTNKPCLVPILYSNAAISDVKLNGVSSGLVVSLCENEFKPFMFGRANEVSNFKNLSYAFSNKIISQNNWQNAVFSLPLEAKGRFECAVSFAIPIECCKDVLSLRLKTASVPLTFVKLKAPDYIISVEETSFNDYQIEEYSDFNTGAQGLKCGSAFVGQLGADGDISLKWRKQFQAPKVQTEAKAVKEGELNVNKASQAAAKEAQKTAETTETAQKLEKNAEETAETAAQTAKTAAEKAAEEAPVTPKPLIFAKSETLFMVNDISLHAQKTFNLYVTKAPISTLFFIIPEDAEILSVVTDRANSKQLIRENGVKKLRLDLLMSREGAIPVSIDYEVKINPENALLTLPNLVLEGAERELETIAVEARASAELQMPSESDLPIEEGIAVIDPAQIPASLSLKSKRPILMAFRRSLSASNITIRVKRYENTPMQTITADSMSIKTSFNKNQNSESLIDLTIRNNNKQYLLLRLASGAKVLHTLRDGKPIASVAGKHEGEIQIPLQISKNAGESVKTSLQIFTQQPIASMSWRGLMNFEAPLADVPISRFDWSIYAPETVYTYNFNSNLSLDTPKHDLFLFIVFNKLVKALTSVLSNPSAILTVLFVVICIMLVVSAKHLIKALKLIGAALYNLFVFLFQGKALASIFIAAVIIAILTSLSVPNFRSARQQMRDKVCFDNQKVLQGAIEMYNMDNVDKPITIYDSSIQELLAKEGYIKNKIANPCKECQLRSEGDLSENGHLYCTLHGSADHPAAYKGDDGVKALESKSARLYYPDTDKVVKGKANSGFNLIKMLAEQTGAKGARGAKAPKAGYGTSSTKGHRAIKSEIALTSNWHTLRRSLVLPGSNGTAALQKNSTTPFVSFLYIDTKAVAAINYLAAVLAFFAGVYLSLAAYYRSGAKLAAFIVISAALLYLNKNFNSMGIYASYGLWVSILGAIIIKTVMLCKNQFSDNIIIKTDNSLSGGSNEVDGVNRGGNGGNGALGSGEAGGDNVGDVGGGNGGENNADRSNGSGGNNVGRNNGSNGAGGNPPSSGRALLPMLILFTALVCVSAAALADETHEVRVMTPFKDLSKVLPEGDRVVIIPEADYRYLTDVKLPEKQPVKPLSPYQILKIDYDGVVQERGVRFLTKYQIETYETGYTPIKLQETSVIAAKALINGKPLSLVAMNCSGRSYYGFYSDGAGKYEVILEYFVPYQKNDISEAKILKMPVLPVSLSALKLTVNEENSEIWVDPGVLISSIHKNSRSEFLALLPPASSVNIEIYKNTLQSCALQKAAAQAQQKALQKEQETAKAEAIVEPTKLSAVKTSLLYFKNGYVSGTDIFDLQIKGAMGIASAAIRVPNEISVLKADGRHIKSWNTKKVNGESFIEITFKNAVHNETDIEIEYEQPLSEAKSLNFEVKELAIPQAEQVSGILGLGALEGLELSVNTSPEGYSTTSPSEFLAKWHKARPEKTPYAFNFLGAENKLIVGVSRPESLAMQTAAINYAEAVSCFNKEGAVLTKLTYEVCNNAQQFLKVKLPKMASGSVELWSCAVDGKAVRAGYDKEFDAYNIPIIRSELVNYEPTPFTVELIYKIKTDKEITSASKLQLMLPSCHLRISRLVWAVFTPDNSDLACLGSNLEQLMRSPELKHSGLSGYLSHKPSRQISNFQDIGGLMPVAFELPLTANQMGFETTSVEPDSKALFVSLRVFNTPEGVFNWLSMLLIFMGALVMTSVIGMFADKKRLVWCIAISVGVIVFFAAKYFNIVQLGRLYGLGAVMALFLFCFYKFMRCRTA